MNYDLTPIFLTFQLAAVTTMILLVIGIPLAYWLAFSSCKMKYVLETLVSLPLVLPPTVLGFYMLVLFSPQWLGMKIVFTFTGLVLGSVIFSLPFMVNPLKAGLESFPVSLMEASYTLGKSRGETLLKVILPNITQSLLTGVVMSFAHTIGEFGVVLMIGGNIPDKTRVASMAIYEEVEALNYGAANFYSLVLIVISFVMLLSLYSFNRKFLKIS